MGTGKSTWKKHCFETMPEDLKNNAYICDLDERIEEMESRSILDIFQNNGENYFRIRESEQFKLILDQMREKAQNQWALVSLGGGTLHEKNLYELGQLTQEFPHIVKVIWLKTSFEVCFTRMNQIQGNKSAQRPLFKGQKNLEQLKKLFIQREKIYSQLTYQLSSEPILDFLELVSWLSSHDNK